MDATETVNGTGGGPEIPQRTKRKKSMNTNTGISGTYTTEANPIQTHTAMVNGNHNTPAPAFTPTPTASENASGLNHDADESVQAAMKATNDVSSTKDAAMSRGHQSDVMQTRGINQGGSECSQQISNLENSNHLSPTTQLERKQSERKPSPRPSPKMSGDRNSVKIRSQRRKSSTRKSSANRLSQLQLINFKPFETFQQLKSISMSLDWIHFKICNGEDEKTELFQAVQSKYCSLRVTNANEIFIRKPNAENILRIHSSIVEDVRNFDFYTNCEQYIGSLICDARQTFKLPSRIENKLTGEIYSVTVERDGDVKFWKIAFVPKTTTSTGSPDNGVEIESDTLPVADVKVHIGHRWKSVYRLTFLQELSISNQVLLLGFLLALASARLESEIFPVLFAVSAIVVTFIIFFIIQFT